jgi:hypothetical protein
VCIDRNESRVACCTGAILDDDFPPTWQNESIAAMLNIFTIVLFRHREKEGVVGAEEKPKICLA